jgi:hypothetical protein
MNKIEEKNLAQAARRAKDLRECVDKANSMILSWSRHKKQASKAIGVSLSDRSNYRWHVSIDLPSELVTFELMPILKRIRDAAAKELRELELPR